MMDRRETLKTLLLGSAAGGFIGSSAMQGCSPPVDNLKDNLDVYGRTPEEMKRDEDLLNQEFFRAEELATIAILCDIILPPTTSSASATEAEVHQFIEFIVKDITSFQLPLRGGLMWLDNEARKRFNAPFRDLGGEQQLQIIDDIAFPESQKQDISHGIRFFNLMRGLTLSGYYTTRMGFNDLGYQGNVPNVWDGVPEDVLQKHDVDYDKEWLAKCVDQSKRNDLAEWDDEMNLLT